MGGVATKEGGSLSSTRDGGRRWGRGRVSSGHDTVRTGVPLSAFSTAYMRGGTGTGRCDKILRSERRRRRGGGEGAKGNSGGRDPPAKY